MCSCKHLLARNTVARSLKTQQRNVFVCRLTDTVEVDVDLGESSNPDESEEHRSIDELNSHQW